MNILYNLSIFLLLSCGQNDIYTAVIQSTRSNNGYNINIVSTIPADDEEHVNTRTHIFITFNDNIKLSSVNSSTFVVDNIQPVSIIYDSAGKTIEYIPETNLSGGTLYTVTLKKGIENNVGETLVSDYSFTFRTAENEPEFDLYIDDDPLVNGQEIDIGTITSTGTRPITFTIKNNGTSLLTLTDIKLYGDDSDQFQLDSIGFPLDIPVDTSYQFSITFSPDSEGYKATTIIIENNDMSEGAFQVNISGNAYAEPYPEVSLWQNEKNIPGVDGVFDFGTVPVGSTSNSIAFTIKNIGSVALDLYSIIIDYKDLDQFLITVPLTAVSLETMETAVFSMNFNPVMLGEKKAYIKIFSSDPNNQYFTFQVRGRGY